VTETDTDYFLLSRVSFDEMTEMMGKSSSFIFEGIASVLAMRVRMMNKELRALRE